MISVYIDDQRVFEGAVWSLLDYQFVRQELAEVLCIGFNRLINDEFLSQFPNLKYILSPTTAIDHIQTSRDVEIIKLIPEEIGHIKASSEFTLLLVLSALRRFDRILKHNQEVGEDIAGKTVGILGYGRIGKTVKKYLEAMGAYVIWSDKESGHSKEYLFSSSDIIIVSASACPENYHLVDYADFDKIKIERPIYFVNISRGFLVNDQSLLQALYNGKVKYAAVDVIEDTKNFTHYLDLHSNLIFTGHVAGSTIQSRHAACNFVINKLAEKLK